MEENINSKFRLISEDLIGIYDKWKSSPLLKGCHHSRQLAAILDNQQVVAEQMDVANNPIYDKLVNVAAKAYHNNPIFHMVSVQPFKSFARPAYFLKTVVEDNVNIWEQADGQVPKISILIDSEQVATTTKTARTHYTSEQEEKDDFVDLLGNEFREDIFREVCIDLRNCAGTNVSKSIDFTASSKEVFESIYVTLVEMSNVIHRKTLRGGANWIVAGPRIVKLLASQVGYHVEDDIKETKYVGTLNARWRIIVDPRFPDSQILVGYKGDSIIDCGYAYCPHSITTSPRVSLEGKSLRNYLLRRGKRLCSGGWNDFGLIKFIK